MVFTLRFAALLKHYIFTALWSLSPLGEAKVGIPYGLLHGVNIYLVFAVCFAAFFCCGPFSGHPAGHISFVRKLYAFIPQPPNFVLLGRFAPQMDRNWGLRDKNGEFSDNRNIPRGMPGKGLQQKSGKKNGKFQEHPREARGDRNGKKADGF
mgnify:CR=1 FL=1